MDVASIVTNNWTWNAEIGQAIAAGEVTEQVFNLHAYQCQTTMYWYNNAWTQHENFQRFYLFQW